ncbi:MAG: methyltransferase domain-containing protein [Anaerolineae bacterium]|nr:methyltransferase domain-containing protein [Anaerolineae bacterium]
MSENNASNYDQQLEEARQIWNSEASSFDNQPDHGLQDPMILAAWTRLLKAHLPFSKATVLDIGCGTGSLSVVIAGLGHDVTGIDFSPEMIAQAQAKAGAAQQPIQFQVMDAAFPKLPDQQFDVIICRHLLWALPEIDHVLERWVRLLKAQGRLLLIEGYWFTKAGLHAQEILDALPTSLTDISVQNLSDQPDFWGKTVDDERYLITARLQT